LSHRCYSINNNNNNNNTQQQQPQQHRQHHHQPQHRQLITTNTTTTPTTTQQPNQQTHGSTWIPQVFVFGPFNKSNKQRSSVFNINKTNGPEFKVEHLEQLCSLIYTGSTGSLEESTGIIRDSMFVVLLRHFQYCETQPALH
jgi:hypothetical protein